MTNSKKYLKTYIGGSNTIRALNDMILVQLAMIIMNDDLIFVGDGWGADAVVQRYLADMRYEEVIVYADGDKVRNNIGDWNLRLIPVPDVMTGYDCCSQKDTKMAEHADRGLMIWDGKSKETIRNSIRLLNQNKPVTLVYPSISGGIALNTHEDLYAFLESAYLQPIDIVDLLIDWRELLRHAKEEYVYCGQFDTDEFSRCVRGVWYRYFSNRKDREIMTEQDIELYGLIYAYSQLSPCCLSENGLRFKASTYVALELAQSIRDPRYTCCEGSKICAHLINDATWIRGYQYDVFDGDLNDFMDLIKEK